MVIHFEIDAFIKCLLWRNVMTRKDQLPPKAKPNFETQIAFIKPIRKILGPSGQLTKDKRIMNQNH